MKLLHQNHKLALAFIGGVFAAFIADKLWDYYKQKPRPNYSNYDGQPTQDFLNDEAKSLATIKVDNNPSGVVYALNKYGVDIYVLDSFNPSVLKDTLFSVYQTDNAMFANIMNDVPYNPLANNYTTSKEFLTKIAEFSKSIKK